MTDYADWQTPTAHATAIYSQGVPLYSKSTKLASAGVTSLGASGAVTLYNGPVSQIGYELALLLQSSASSLYPLWTLQLSWSDSVTGYETAREQYNFTGAATANYQKYLGTGPTKGDTVNITLTNQDTAHSGNYQFTFAANSRVYVADRFQQPSYFTVPNFTSGSADPSAGFIVQTAPSILAANQATRLLPFYTGLVRIWAISGLAFDVLINALDPAVSTAPAGNSIYEGSVTASGGGFIANQLALPRSQCCIILTNNGGSTATIGATLTTAETPA